MVGIGRMRRSGRHPSEVSQITPVFWGLVYLASVIWLALLNAHARAKPTRVQGFFFVRLLRWKRSFVGTGTRLRPEENRKYDARTPVESAAGGTMNSATDKSDRGTVC